MAHKVRRYAQDTKVRAGVSKDEIERALRRRRAGETLQAIGDVEGKSRERIRCWLLTMERKWERANGQRPLEWERWYVVPLGG